MPPKGSKASSSSRGVKRQSTNIYTRALNNLNEGMKYLEPMIGKTESDLREGFNTLSMAFYSFKDLYDSSLDGVLRVALIKKMKEATNAMNILTNKIQNIGVPIKVVGPTPAINDSPYLEGIEFATEDEKGILRKVQNSIVPRGCGFRKFEDYVGGEPYETFFDNIVVWRKKYQNFKDAHKGTDSVLLFGPPGTGKTLLAQALNSKFPNAVFFSISASDIKGKYFSESEKTLHVLFQLARNYTRKDGRGPNGFNTVIIFMDEIDGLIDEGGSGVGTGLLSQFNNEIQGLGKDQYNKGLIVIGATNYPDKYFLKQYVPTDDKESHLQHFKDLLCDRLWVFLL